MRRPKPSPLWDWWTTTDSQKQASFLPGIGLSLQWAITWRNPSVVRIKHTGNVSQEVSRDRIRAVSLLGHSEFIKSQHCCISSGYSCIGTTLNGLPDSLNGGRPCEQSIRLVCCRYSMEIVRRDYVVIRLWVLPITHTLLSAVLLCDPEMFHMF